LHVIAKEMLVKRSKLARLSSVRDIANPKHFDGSKADGLTIEIVGIGPAASTQAEAK